MNRNLHAHIILSFSDPIDMPATLFCGNFKIIHPFGYDINIDFEHLDYTYVLNSHNKVEQLIINLFDFNDDYYFFKSNPNNNITAELLAGCQILDFLFEYSTEEGNTFTGLKNASVTISFGDIDGTFIVPSDNLNVLNKNAIELFDKEFAKWFWNLSYTDKDIIAVLLHHCEKVGSLLAHHKPGQQAYDILIHIERGESTTEQTAFRKIRELLNLSRFIPEVL